MRAVAREADVAVGLTNYHFDNKVALICAAASGDAATQLRDSLRRALDPSFLRTDYLSLRLQLWSLAGVDEKYATINQAAQRNYLTHLADLVAAARPDLDRREVDQRAVDILVTQNGVWLTAVLITDEAAVARALAHCEARAFD